MCGIYGIIRCDGSVRKQELDKMGQTMQHRGPDFCGSWVSDDGKVGLGHTRLSIIDVSSSGNQPFRFQHFVLSFNGEIYNFLELKEELEGEGIVFKTNSDTEVLAACYAKYGTKALEKLDGMFAFALYDLRNQKLFFARDRFGEKPFFYFKDQKKFVFSSEMKAIWKLGIPKQVDEGQMFNFSVHGEADFNNEEQTFYQNIKSLPPSHYMIFDVASNRSDVQSYWRLEEGQLPINKKDAIEKFTQLFETSVMRRMRSDVPLGSSLSGGLDSSMIVETVNKYLDTDSRVSTFSAIFPGFERDESRFQEMVADQISSIHHKVYPSMEENLAVLDQVLYHQEEPFGSASIIAQYHIFKLAKENGIKVLLDGQGADEMLAGYSHTASYYLRELLVNFKWAIYLYEGFQCSQQQKTSIMNTYGKSLAHIVPKSLVSKVKVDHAENQAKYLNLDFSTVFTEQRNGSPYFDSLNDKLHHLLFKRGLPRLLKYSDRNAMAHSIEVRLPFLSHELVQFVFSLPSNLKIRHGWSKWIARKAYENRLPSEIIWRKKKVGFETDDNYFSKLQSNQDITALINEGETKNYFVGDSSKYPSQMFWRRLILSRLLDNDN